MPLFDTIIVGAGVSGVACYNELQSNQSVLILEKSRGIGGRTSRRSAADASFDMGAQFFTVRDPVFAKVIERLKNRGHVAEWTPKIDQLYQGNWRNAKESRRFVGVPAMNSWLKELVDRQHIQFEKTVKKIVQDEGVWSVEGDDFNINSRKLVLTQPLPQVLELCSNSNLSLPNQLQSATYKPCWTAGLKIEGRYQFGRDAAFVNSHSLSWIANNATKPGRTKGFDYWTVHGDHDWSLQNSKTSKKEAADFLRKQFVDLTGIAIQDTEVVFAHRWKYAAPEKFSLTSSYYLDAKTNLGICGDWFMGGRVEGAYLSGYHLGQQLLA